MIPTPAVVVRSCTRARRWSTAAAVLLALAPPVARPDGTAPGTPPIPPIRVVSGSGSARLQVDGRDFMVLGMNWDYVPIGKNYAYSLWTQPDDVIKDALDREMPLLKRMGVNALRQYVGIQPRWVRYIYERYGIYTVLNHTVGRYGYQIDGSWVAQVDYANPRFRAAVQAEVLAIVDQFRDTPGVLMWLLGNENNYGLSWSSFEIENLPAGERDAARARHLYSLFGEVIRAIKARDPLRPVAIANGDVQYIDLVAEECKGLDVFGANVYRGMSFGDVFQVVKAKLGLPVMFTEFGADAYDARRMREDDVTQAKYLVANWREIYENSADKGLAGNSIGGFTFQWSDGWWKYNQEKNLDVHDTVASWSNGGYLEDYVKGENNMNEEWYGICAKGPPDERGLFDLYPRSGYYALQQAYTLPPYGPGTTLAAIRAHFDSIQPAAFAHLYRADRAALAVADLGLVRVTGLRLSFESYSTGGNEHWVRSDAPSRGVGFDHTESFYADFQVKPSDHLVGNLSLNVLGNVAQNPIDQIFYENRAWPVRVACAEVPGQPVRCGANPDGTRSRLFSGQERLKVYSASVAWDDPWFKLDGFFRTGHYHWGYDGDFFGLYREANYGSNIDTYNADAPLGFEASGKKALDGLTLAFGPQLWWGANPAVMGKYRRSLGPLEAAVVYEEDLAAQTAASNSSTVPQKPTRKATLYLSSRLGPAKLELGGIWAGSTKVGQTFFRVAGATTLPDRIRDSDALGVKAKLGIESGVWHWYAQGAYMGLVADAGPTAAVTYTGWTLKDSGSGNQASLLTGLAVNLGQFQIAPNFLWQKPLVGPVPNDVGRPRNVLDDPFVVRGNRETVAGELMLVFDPTPGTWMWAWDNDLREDARFAASLDFTFRHQPTTQDANVGILADGVTQFRFPGAPPPHDVWETQLRFVSALRADLRIVGHAFVGRGESTGIDGRLTRRFGGDVRVGWRSWALQGFARFNDWGPYDFQRDFNQTYPVQLMGDLSYNLGLPKWLGLGQSRIGVRGTVRYLNGYSGPRFCPSPQAPRLADGSCDPNLPGGSSWGQEHEIRSYVNLQL